LDEIDLYQKILWYLKENPDMTAKAIANVFGVDTGEVQKKLRELGVDV